ncbi:hypothetical protein F4809DRAFT_647364 [Biscogniauxia mediterranea]|nr:hypothetical protein F4809DRAFT_647364 [Biscogniauxia mediterranea]
MDIRDIDKDQTIFWIIALPTTAVVMSLAFIYGAISSYIASRNSLYTGVRRDLVDRWGRYQNWHREYLMHPAGEVFAL